MSNSNKKQKTTKQLHAIQKAKVLQAIDAIEEDKGVILGTPTGSGKTDMARLMAKKYANGKDRVLSVLITTDADQAKKLSPLFGGYYAGGFQFNYANNIKKALDSRPVHITMTKKMFKDRLLEYDKEDKSFTEYEDRFVDAIKPSEIHFLIDEMSDYLDIFVAIERLRKKSSVTVLITGLDATSGADQSENMEKYKRMFGKKEVEVIEMTDAEYGTYKKDVCKQPEAPKKWVDKFRLPPPGPEHAEALDKLMALIVGDKLFTTTDIVKEHQAPPLMSWKAKEDILGCILAEQAADGDNNAGDDNLVFKAISTGDPMNVVGGNILVRDDDGNISQSIPVGTDTMCSESVLIAHWFSGGITKHMEILKGLCDDKNGDLHEGTRTHTYHDLRAKRNIEGFHKAFKEQQTGFTLGFMKSTNCKSTNDHSKNTTSIIAIAWPSNTSKEKNRLKQLKGRIDSRPVGFEDGDIIPNQQHLTHIKSQWSEDLINTLKKRPSLRTQTKPSGFDDLYQKAIATFPQYTVRIDLKVAQLLTLDNSKLLGDTGMASRYLELLASHKAKAKFMTTYDDIQRDFKYKRVQVTRTYQDEDDEDEDDQGNEDYDGGNGESE